jgi:omega-6 fatty acid desaturase (delta-12 desaturase)
MTGKTNLRREVAQFQAPILRTSVSQLTTSFGGFFATCAAMYAVIDVSTWIALALAPLAAGFLVRIFIIQHDCGHFSFFRTRRANDIAGLACSLLTLTPYASWRRQHAGHHGIWNDLDRRQSGADIYSSCLTVAEYRALSAGKRCWYRATRHPLVANLLLPPLIFILLYRLPFDMPKSWRRERRMVHLTTLALIAALGGLGLLLGYGRVAAVHHLNPRVPNYRLQECHERIASLCDVPAGSFWKGLRSLGYVLWDEDRDRMTTFREAARGATP